MTHDALVPDVHTSSEDYGRRFGGRGGQYLLDVQAACVRRLLRQVRVSGLRVLDVGGGHGQLTQLFLDAGHDVCVHGSSPVCASRLQPLMARFPDRLRFVTSSLWQLPFPEGSFDLVVALRLLPHVERWQSLLGEMARVARKWILFDYTERYSVNLLGRVVFPIKRRLEGNTRPYFCHSTAQLTRRLGNLGFVRVAVVKEFFLPVGAHRLCGWPGVSAGIEGCCRTVGLTRCLGSPGLMLARRDAAG